MTHLNKMQKNNSVVIGIFLSESSARSCIVFSLISGSEEEIRKHLASFLPEQEHLCPFLSLWPAVGSKWNSL